MRLVEMASTEAAANVVARRLDGALTSNPRTVLGLAAGATPRRAYEILRDLAPPVDQCRMVLLDEYLGLPGADPRSFRQQIRTELTVPLGLDDSQLLSLDGTADGLADECAAFEHKLAGMGGVDLQLLGMGRNGHIAFNEPGSAHDSRTRVVDLSEVTRTDNAEPFADREAVPSLALTQGIGTILEARQILLLVTGVHKASALAAALEGPVTATVPASALQLHPNVVVIADHPATAALSSEARAFGYTRGLQTAAHTHV